MHLLSIIDQQKIDRHMHGVIHARGMVVTVDLKTFQTASFFSFSMKL